MRRLLIGLMLGALLVSAMPTAVFAAAPNIPITTCGGRPGVRFYKDKNYQGVTLTLCIAAGSNSSIDVDSFPSGWNDQASSYQFFNAIRVAGHPSWSMRVYSDSNQTGKYITSTSNANIPDLSQYWVGTWPTSGFNDKASSMRFIWVPA